MVKREREAPAPGRLVVMVEQSVSLTIVPINPTQNYSAHLGHFALDTWIPLATNRYANFNIYQHQLAG